MSKGKKGAITGAVGTLLVVLLVQSGVVSFSLPDALRFDSLVDKVATQERELELKESATIVRLEAVALDCRARIHARVPVEGRREHALAGVVYRTDTVEVDASGDVDTCVDAGAVEITESEDGSFTVDIPGEAISFVRPRVDMVDSAERFTYDKGFVGELTDTLPGVDDTDTMIPAAFAYAQQIIGGNACMTEAFDVTSQVLEQAYRDQLAAQGADGSRVTVDVGEPDFDQNRPLEETGDIAFDIRGGEVLCTLSPDAHEGASPDWEDFG